MRQRTPTWMRRIHCVHVSTGTLHFLGGVCRIAQTLTLGSIIAKSKSPSTFAKRQREQEKKRKASEKLQRRHAAKRRQEAVTSIPAPPWENVMTPKDAATCSDFWKEVLALTEIVHTRGAEGLLDLLMEDFATLPGEKRTLVQRQLSTLIGMLPFLKQAKAACVAGPTPVSQKVPYRD